MGGMALGAAGVSPVTAAGAQVAAAVSVGAAAGVQVANNVADLKALPVKQLKLQDGQLVDLLGYINPGDGGGGLFRYLSSSAAEDTGIVFTANGGGHFERLYDTSWIRAEWFGADPTGKNATPQAIHAIQLAIDYALQHVIAEVRLGNGTFQIIDTIQLGYGDTFRTVSLVGAGPQFGDGFSGTVIVATFKDRPAIAIQGARYSAVKDLTLRGVNLDHVNQVFSGDFSTKALQLIDPASWVDAAFLQGAPNADSQHAPYAGIAIDPYSGSKPSDGYPDVSYPSWVTNRQPYGKDFSTGVLIENVHIAGFVVGVVNQPCNADENGDFTKIHKCSFVALKYGISIGNSQSRNVSIRDCEYGLVHTFLTNTTHGRRSGQLGGPIDNISGGASFQFADLFLSYSGAVRFSNIYFESQIKFGRLGVNASDNSPAVFESCSFGPDSSLHYNPDCFITTSPYATLNFIGCNLVYYGKFMNLVNDQCAIVFDCCTFVNDQSDSSYTPSEKIAQNQLCGGVYCYRPPQVNGAINSTAWLGTTPSPYLYSNTVSGTRGIVHQGAERLSYTSNNYPGNFVMLRARKQPIFLGKQDATLNGDTLTFTNPGQDGSYFYTAQVGDLVYDPFSQTLFVIDSISGKSITAKIEINFRVENGNKVPNAPGTTIQTTGYFIVISSSCFKTDFEYRGNTTAGSKVIANVRRPDGYSGLIGQNFAAADLLFHSGELWDQNWPFPEVTRIVSVDPQAGTITVDQSATNTINDIMIGILK